MKKWLEVLKEEVSENAQQRILAGADQALAANQKGSRRTLFWWVGGLVTAGVGWWLLPAPPLLVPDEDRSLVMELDEEGEEVSEAIADLDLIEELEILENWNGEV